MTSTSAYKENQKTDELRLRQAAGLLKHAEGWWQDRRFRRDHENRLFYAVDADIITMHIAPILKASYANIFEQENLQTPELLTRLISDFIFYREDPTRHVPLMILHPHDEEVSKMGNAISNKLLHQIEEVSRNLIGNKFFDKHLDEFGRNRNYNMLVQQLCDEAPRLVKAFDEYQGLAGQLNRLTTLWGSGKVLTIDHYFDAPSKWSFPVLDIENDKEGADLLNKLQSDWGGWLEKSKPPGKRQYALSGDAEVLARLEWINQQIESQKCRLVLITGSYYIFAAAEYAAVEKEEKYKDFSTLYLRHPRSFLAYKKFFRKSIQSSEEIQADFALLDWLNLFFPSVFKDQYLSRTVDRLVDPEALAKLLNPSHHDFRSTLVKRRQDETTIPLENYVNQWSEQVRATAVAWNIKPGLFKIDHERVRDRESAKKLADRLLAHKNGPGLDEVAFVKALYAKSLISLNHLYSAPAWIGLWSRASAKNEYIRGIPYLNFSMNPGAQEYCNEVLGRLHDPKHHVDLVKMYNALAEQDQSNYLAHTVHALAYATKGHWHAARTLCQVAIAVVDQLPVEERGSRKGREAAYLAAVSARRLMQHVSDLETASKMLDEAVKRDEDDHHDLRFDSERWAIVTAKHHFKYFKHEDIPDIPTIKETLAGLEIVIYKSLSKRNNDCQNWIQRQSLINLFNMLFIATKSNTDPHKASEWLVSEPIEFYLDIFQKVTESIPQDGSARVTFEMSYALWGSDSSNRKHYAIRVISYNLPTTSPFSEIRQTARQQAVHAVYEQLK